MGCVRYIHNYMLLLMQVQWVLVFVLVQVVHHFPPLFLQSAGQLVVHVLEQVVDVGLELPPGRLHALPHLGPGLPSDLSIYLKATTMILANLLTITSVNERIIMQLDLEQLHCRENYLIVDVYLAFRSVSYE